MIQEPGIEFVDSSEVHRFPGYSLFMRRDNIIELHFENGFSGSVGDARNMVRLFKKLRGRFKPSLLVICSEDNTFSKEAREYTASKEVSDVLKADAFVIRGLALRIIGNGYLKINRPSRPTRLFNSKEEAIDWLKRID
jgi:hypothetical protein